MTDNPRKKEPPPEAGPPPADAGPPEAEPAQAEPAETGTLEEQLANAKEDAQKYLGNWQRAEADFQNYKRRVEQERSESRRFAAAALIINVLPILDDLERALGSLDARLAGLTWFEGIVLIHRKLLVLLDNAGVTPIEAEGQQFDPSLHEAVTHVDGEDGKVLTEVQRGYKLHDRVLRPAMVVVGKGEPAGPSGAKEETKEEKETEAPEAGDKPEQASEKQEDSGQGTVDSGQGAEEPGP
ncbi:MAG: nucleotide exchange factor GrpE [Chloroflexi bacterium]|nr:nucleotide exchange factor GrpE [Chloroflexota bacterium]